MADIQVQDLIDAYESEIGTLRGMVIRNKVAHEAELKELRTAQQVQLQRINEDHVQQIQALQRDNELQDEVKPPEA